MASKSKVTRKNPKALQATRRIAVEMGKFRVRVGWAEDMGADPETVQIAAINVMGAPAANIPARDPITPMMQAERARIRGYHGKAMQLANAGKDPEPVLDKLAAHLENEAKAAVDAFAAPANAPSTVKKKGFNDPLIGAGSDHGRLYAEVSAKVSKR